jgi:hypothetical protein
MKLKNLKNPTLETYSTCNSSKFRGSVFRNKIWVLLWAKQINLNEKREIREKAEIVVMAIKEYANYKRAKKTLLRSLD